MAPNGDQQKRGFGRRAVAGTIARPFAPVFGGWPALSDWPARGWAWLRAGVTEEIERRRLLPWFAVAYGIGILLGFVADAPSIWPALAVGLGLLLAGWASRAALARQMVLLACGAVFLGLATTGIRIVTVDAPVLSRLTITKATGFVESVDEQPGGGGRLVLRVASLDRMDKAEWPERVRLSVRSLAGISPGDFVQVSARLLPPPEAARPGGYDFARDAYFRGLGAVGSVSGKVAKAEPDRPADLSLRFAAGVDRARNALTARIAGSIGGQAGAVAAALVTGKRGLIEEKTNDVLRAAGIYHVVSISGLHMVLAAGVFFALARGFMALSPALALGWPIKKIAAVVGMVAATAYCIFSGAEVATERSLVMILVMQGAILFDRPAMSMRNLGLSALIVLAREPEALLGPSFQMSYGAVAGLITLAEVLRRRHRPVEPGDPIRRAALWVGGILGGIIATTLVATVATSAFATYHFQIMQPYGLIGNAATLPLVSFAVMPAAVLGVLALPFGLDRPVWAAMGYAVEAVLKLSGWVAGFPTSTVVTPAFGGGALLLLSLALLTATLFGSRLRWLAVLPLSAGLALASTHPKPDIYVARDGSGAAVRRADGRLVILGPVPAFTVTQWLRADGDGRDPADPSLRDPARCDAIGCTALLRDSRAVATTTDRRGFDTDCRRATILVSRLKAPPGCAPAHLLDRTHLDAHGASTLRMTPTGIVTESVRRPAGSHPWLRKAEARKPSAPAPDVATAPDPAEDEGLP